MAKENFDVTWDLSTPLNSFAELDVLGYSCLGLSFVKTGTISAGTIVFEGTNDGTNWYSLNGINISDLSTALSYDLSGSSRFWQVGVIGLTLFRIRLSVVITGSGTATLKGKSSAVGVVPAVASVGGGGGGSVAWGGITGTLSNQTDLQSALNAKAELPLAISDVTGLQTSLDSKLVAPIVTANISDAQITNAKLANMVQATLKGRAVGAGTGVPTDLTPAQATAILDVFASGSKGLVPASGGGATTFLRADGTFAPPPGSGSGQLNVDLVAGDANVTWTNMPAAVTFFNGSHRYATRVDLSNYTQVRLVVNKQGTAGAASSIVRLRYITAFSTTVGSWLTIGSSELSIAVNTQNVVTATSWINLVAGAIADVFITLDGSGGDGVIDPIFGKIVAQFR